MRNLALELRLTAAVGGPGTLVGVYLTAAGAHRLLTQGSSGLPWLLGGLAAGALAVTASGVMIVARAVMELLRMS